MKKTIIGIDFGTTKIAVAITSPDSPGDPEIIEIDGLRTTETALRLSPEGDAVEEIGIRALETAAEFPERTFCEFKPGDGVVEAVTPNATYQQSAFDLSVLLLSTLRAKIEKQLFNEDPLGKESVSTIIGCPDRWGKAQVHETLKAARQAGFPNVRTCEESRAALNYFHQIHSLPLDADGLVITYDFGGGSSDVSLIRTRPDKPPKIIGICSDPGLGGSLIDEEIAKYFADKLCKEMGQELELCDRLTLKKFSREVKEKLARNTLQGVDHADVVIPKLEVMSAPYDLRLSRDEFEMICRDLIERCAQPLTEVIEDADVAEADVTRLLLTGGSSQMHYVASTLAGYLPSLNDSELIHAENPGEITAKGLAIHGQRRVGASIMGSRGVPPRHGQMSTVHPENKVGGPWRKRRIYRGLFASFAAILVIVGVWLIWFSSPPPLPPQTENDSTWYVVRLQSYRISEENVRSYLEVEVGGQRVIRTTRSGKGEQDITFDTDEYVFFVQWPGTPVAFRWRQRRLRPDITLFSTLLSGCS